MGSTVEDCREHLNKRLRISKNSMDQTASLRCVLTEDGVLLSYNH